jgi:sporulation protein YlmC with PRC-barrel domain
MADMSDKQLRDKHVVTADGHLIGTLEELIINTETRAIVAIGVRLRRDSLEALGLEKPWIRRPEIKVPVREISGISDQVVLRHKAADLDFSGGQPSSTDRP